MSVPQGVIDAVNAFRAADKAVGRGLSKVGQTASEAFLYDPKTKKIIPRSPLHAENRDMSNPDNMMNVASIIGSVNAVDKMAPVTTRLVTDVPRQNLISDQTPYILKEGGKVYGSIRQAIKAAKMKPMAEGEVLMPRALHPSQLDILKQRLIDLKKGGFNTANVEKAIAKEMKVGR